MQFNSLTFLAFFPITAFIYFVIPNKIKNYWLFLVNYIFYAYWNVKLALLLFVVTTFSYCVALLIDKKNKKILYPIALCVLLLILFVYKYLNYTIVSISNVIRMFGIDTTFNSLDLIMPLGISFYIFTIIGYVVDVYKGKIKAEKNYIKYSIYVTFFLKIAQGPIEKAESFIKQLDDDHSFKWNSFFDGLLLGIWGYFLKIVLADRIGLFVDTIFGDIETYNGMYLLVAIILFSIQIYADFYGYSCIASGTSEIMGFKLIENFKQPYLSNSIAEFWRGWHISLTNWFKEYVYIPLGGNRKGKLRKYLNKVMVFTLSGLWHGASMSYVVWGAINGIYQVIEENIFDTNKNKERKLKPFRVVLTFVLITFSWIFFRSGTMETSIQVIKSIANAKNMNIMFDGSLFNCGLDKNNFILMMLCILLLIIVDIINFKSINIRKYIFRQKDSIKIMIIVISILFLLLFGLYGPKFNKATFIYFNY